MEKARPAAAITLEDAMMLARLRDIGGQGHREEVRHDPTRREDPEGTAAGLERAARRPGALVQSISS